MEKIETILSFKISGTPVMDVLPNEIFAKIFTSIPRYWVHCERVCRRWKVMIGEEVTREIPTIRARLRQICLDDNVLVIIRGLPNDRKLDAGRHAYPLQSPMITRYLLWRRIFAPKLCRRIAKAGFDTCRAYRNLIIVKQDYDHCIRGACRGGDTRLIKALSYPTDSRVPTFHITPTFKIYDIKKPVFKHQITIKVDRHLYRPDLSLSTIGQFSNEIVSAIVRKIGKYRTWYKLIALCGEYSEWFKIDNVAVELLQFDPPFQLIEEYLGTVDDWRIQQEIFGIVCQYSLVVIARYIKAMNWSVELPLLLFNIDREIETMFAH